VLWPGIRDILDDWVTIVTVGALGAALWFGLEAQHIVELRKVERAQTACLDTLKRTRTRAPPPVPEPTMELPWPWKW
jgi:hypothetical protein